MNQKLIKVCAIIGPTAVGKSDVALRLAEIIEGSIVNADSMQLYCGLDIGTAKPSLATRKQVPHHLYDIVSPLSLDIDSPLSPMDAAKYATAAKEAIGEIDEAGRRPIVVGGSGLYLRALFGGLITVGPASEEIRKEINDIEAKEGMAAARSRLLALDPEAAEQIHANDNIRNRRALEILMMTGKSRRQWQAVQAQQTTPPYKFCKMALTMNRSELYERINKRVKMMFENGLLQEVDQFKPGCERGIGYIEARKVREGKMSCDEAVEVVAKLTRNYAKRQITWFKKEKDVKWFDLSDDSKERSIKAIHETVKSFLNEKK